MKKIFKSIGISEINLENDLFCYSYPQENEFLKQSIKKTGIFKPVILYKKGDDYIVVDGRKRIVTAIELGINNLDSVIIYPGEETEDRSGEYQLFRSKIYDTHAQGIRLNDVEISIILNKLVKDFSKIKADVMKEYFPLFGIPGYYSDIYFHLVKMDENIKDYIVENHVPVSYIKSFFYFNQTELPVIFNMIRNLNIKGSNLKIVLSQLEEIIRRDKKDLQQFLEESGVYEIMKNKKMTKSQKLGKVKKVIWENRFPVLKERISNIEDKLGSIKMPKNIKMSIPPFLEGTAVNFSVSIGKSEDLNRTEKAFNQLIENRSFIEALELL